MSTPVIDVGDDVKLTLLVTVSGAATDPSTLTLKLRDPSGNEQTIQYPDSRITKDATGSYTAVIAATTAGTWYYRWEGTGDAKGAEQGTFQVRRSLF